MDSQWLLNSKYTPLHIKYNFIDEIYNCTKWSFTEQFIKQKKTPAAINTSPHPEFGRTSPSFIHQGHYTVSRLCFLILGREHDRKMFSRLLPIVKRNVLNDWDFDGILWIQHVIRWTAFSSADSGPVKTCESDFCYWRWTGTGYSLVARMFWFYSRLSQSGSYSISAIAGYVIHALVLKGILYSMALRLILN